GQVDAGQRVVDRLRQADVDTAEGVDHVGETGETDLRVAVDAQAGGDLHGLHQQLRHAEGEGRVELVAAVAGDAAVGIARQAHQRGRAGAGDVHQHDGVGALGADLATGGQLLFLLGGQPRTAVRADQQPVGARGVAHPVLVVRQRVDPGELAVQVDD